MNQSRRMLFIVVYVAVWGGLIFAALQVARLPIAPIHFLCGPWGCLGSTSALLSIHLLWIAILVPLVVLLVWAVPCLSQPWVWWWVLVAACLLLITQMGWDVWQYLAVQHGEAEFLSRRVLYCLVSGTDIPAWQLVVAALAGFGAARLRHSKIAPVEPKGQMS